MAGHGRSWSWPNFSATQTERPESPDAHPETRGDKSFRGMAGAKLRWHQKPPAKNVLNTFRHAVMPSLCLITIIAIIIIII